MRNLNKDERLMEIASKEKISLKVAQLDINDDSSADNVINSIINENGKIDLLINNEGHDLFGFLEEASIEEITQQSETNLFGILRATKVV